MASISRPRWEGDDKLPPAHDRLAELAWNFARLVQSPSKGAIGPADGPPLLVIPGFLATDRTTTALRQALAADGWRVHGWENGWNLGVCADTIEVLKRRVEAIGAGKPIPIVGWSLGGLFAREFARSHPELVKGIVTLGSPFSGDARQNNVWKLYELVAGHPVDQPPIPRITDKPPVPHLAIWSRRDGLIAPRSARGLDHERDAEIEMDCRHMAFGVSRKATRKVAREIEAFLKALD